MDFGRFRQVIGKILEADLPKGKPIIDEGRALARQVSIGRTAFMDKMGVSSEVEYKRACMKEGRVMFHAHIGMSSWAASKNADGCRLNSFFCWGAAVEILLMFFQLFCHGFCR